MNENQKDLEMETPEATEPAAEAEAPAEETAAEAASEGKVKGSDKKKLKKVEAELAETKKKLEAAEAALAEEKDKYLRMLAEYDNFRRRTAKEKETIYGDATADTIKGLLSVDKESWLADVENIKEFYAQVGDHVPAEMYEELAALEARLSK